MMEPVKEKGGRLLESVFDYLELRMKLLTLQAADKSSRILTGFFTIIIIVFIFIFSMIMLSIAAAIGIGNALNHPWLGYLIIGIFYIIAGVVLVTMKEKLIFEPLLNTIVHSIAGAEIKAENKAEKVQDKIQDKLNLNKPPEE